MKLLSEAKAAFVPTVFIEPFGGVAIECMLSGCPVITSDMGDFTETVLNSHVGYRCHTFEEFVWAAKNIDKINPQTCRDWALNNYSTDRAAVMYEEAFRSIMHLRDMGWYQKNAGRHSLDHLKMTYPGQTPPKLPEKFIPTPMTSSWSRAQAFENAWWGTKDDPKWDKEIEKQKVYAKLLDLPEDLTGLSILDVGGGPISMLLRSKNFKAGVVVDPLTMSEKTKRNYELSNISLENIKAEDYVSDIKFDEVWIYNCLMHVDDPGAVLRMAFKRGRVVRIFEALNEGGKDPGHPHNITEEWMDAHIGPEWERKTWNRGVYKGLGLTNTDEYLAAVLALKA